MRWVMKIFGQGLMVLVPLSVTLWLVLAMGMWVEGLLANPFKDLFPGSDNIYRMGMGIASLLLIIFLFGLLLNFWVVRRLFALIEESIKQLPVVKTVYGAIQDVIRFISGGNGGMKGDMVVVVEQINGWRQVGIVTRQDFSGLPAGLTGNRDQVAVYFPFSYQLGGFTYFVDRDRCQPVKGMTVEDAMRYAMMGFLGTTKPEQEYKNGDNHAAPDTADVSGIRDQITGNPTVIP